MTAIREATRRDSGIWSIPRDEFVTERFDYRAGEHAVFGGPTQRGKTTLAMQLLDEVATPEVPAYIAVSKPLDPVTLREAKRMQFRIVRDWPVPPTVKQVFGDKPRGYVVYPPFGDIDRDATRAAAITRRLIADRYSAGAKVGKGRGILVMDDTMVKSQILGLDKEMRMILAMSGAMGLGQWTFVQKPTDSGRTAIWSYGASEHVFLTRDPDRKNQARYDEIGGVDPKLVASIMDGLAPYEFLYIKRTGGQLCIVEAD